MANVITSFLVGIGLDTSEFESGEKRVNQAMEGVKSSTLAIGSAMAAAAIGAGVRVDQLAEKSRKLQDQLYRTNTETTWAQGYGVALTELGGNADDAVGRITGLEEKLAAIKMGDRGWVDSLGPAGFDAGDLAQARDAQDFITRAADQFSRATHTQQVNMAAVLGLTDAEFKLWQQGGSYVDAHTRQLAEQIGYTESLNQKQYEYSQSWVELNLEMDKAGNTISEIMLPGMTELVKKANEYTGALNKFARENPETTEKIIGTGAAVGAGAAALTGAKVLSKVPGLGGLGGAALPIAAGIAGGFWANDEWSKIMEDSDNWYGKETIAGGNLKKNSPLGKTASYLSDWGSSLWGDLTAPPPMWQANDRHRINVERNRRGESTLPSSYPIDNKDYAPATYNSDYNAAAVGGVAAAAVTAMPPLRIDNKLNLTGVVELDGMKMGEIVDAKIDQHNQQAITQFDTQVSR